MKDTNNARLARFLLFALIFFLVYLFWQLRKNLAGWFWQLDISETRLNYKPFWGEEIILEPNDVQNFYWDNSFVTINTLSQQVRLNYHPLNTLDSLRLTFALIEWIPIHLFPVDVQEDIKLRKNRSEETNSFLNQTIKIENDRRQRYDTGIFLVAIWFVCIGGLAWMVYNGRNGSHSLFDMIITYLILAGLSIAGLVVTWIYTRYTEIYVSAVGIQYNQRKKQKLYLWENISAISISPFMRTTLFVYIWGNDQKENRIQLDNIKEEHTQELCKVILKQAYARKIPANIG